VAWIVLRTVIEETAVSKAGDAFSQVFPRFDDAWDALKWLLAREPAQKNAARHVANGGTAAVMVYVQAADPLAKTPEIWVVYTYTSDSITILGVNAVQAQEPPE
jgi:hypothetical protein